MKLFFLTLEQNFNSINWLRLKFEITHGQQGCSNTVLYFGSNNLHLIFPSLKRSIFTTSKTDHQSLCQKVRQRISVMKTNNGVFVVFKTKHELKCQFSGNTSPLRRFFDELFDVIFDDPFLTL